MRYIFSALFVLMFGPLLQAQTQGWFTYDTTNSSIPSNVVTGVQVDAQNAVWVATINGLAKFEDFFSWTLWNSANSDLPDDWITSLTIDASGRKWIGTLTGGLAVLDGNTITVYDSQNSPLSSDHITSVNFEGSTAWITTDGGGLYRFNGSTWQNYTLANTGVELDVCYDVAVDGSGNKWIGTLSAGLVKLSGGVFTGFDPSDSDLPFELVRSVAVENDTTIWVGMGYTNNDSALAKFNGSNTFVIYSANDSQSIHFRNVWDILVTDEGEKWFCTNDLEHGAIYYNDTLFRDYSSFNSGMPYNRVYGVAVDTGNAWFATQRGLAVFNENNAYLQVAEQPLLAAYPYPNPATERINVVMASHIHQVRVSVYGMDGKPVLAKRVDNLPEGRLELAVNELRAGFYMAAVEAQGRVGYFKFIKQ